MTENADVIFVGNKPPMSYVLAIITSLSSGNLKEITLKARGQAITTAVDVAEIARNRFIKDLKVSKIAHRIGLTPNSISVIGFLLAIASAVSYALATADSLWWLLLAVVFMLASGFCDTMDGIVARTFQQTSAFGGFFDSVLDRFADGAAYAGIIVAGLCAAAFGGYWGTIVALSALIASMLVSYTRARAEVTGVKMESVGIAERAERMLILAAVSIIGYFYLPALGYGVALIALLSVITVLQRVVHVYRELKIKQ